MRYPIKVHVMAGIPDVKPKKEIGRQGGKKLNFKFLNNVKWVNPLSGNPLSIPFDMSEK